ncbi:MAG: zincin, partial [Olpidium bornovanus]
LIARATKIQDEIAALSPETCTFDAAVCRLGDLENSFATESATYYFPQYVHPDKAVRDASLQANQAIKEFEIESAMRLDLFEAVCAAAKHPSSQDLQHEDKRLLDRFLLDFRRNGLALPAAEREKLKALRKREADLSIKFQANMNEDTTSLALTAEELAGMPADWLSSLNKDPSGKYIVTMKYPDLIPALKLCSNPTTRRRLAFANDSKTRDNVKLLEEALKLRAEAAAVLGYESHSAFELETKMAKTPETVRNFLDELRTKLRILAAKELEVLEKLKADEIQLHGRAEGEESDRVASYDSTYLTRILLEKNYQVDHEAIKQYFSLAKVTTGMLGIYEAALGCKFLEVPDDKKKVWHPDVRMFEVWDADCPGQFIGHFYLDLHPRDGKYTHAACFGIIPGYTIRRADGTIGRQFPAAAMVANFSKPTAETPSLLKHNEFETYFHELGHVMHTLLSETKWSRFHGTAVERDFVEAPSQVLGSGGAAQHLLALRASRGKNSKRQNRELGQVPER